jgi:hypothetical protein
MQLQVQQQIAEALLAKGLQDQEPVTHGPSGNPYAYDSVNIGGILSKLISARQGREQLEGILPQQLALAAQSEAMRKQDMAGVWQDIAGGPTPGPYVGGSIDKKPDMVAAIRRALLSSHPAVQAQGQEMQKAWIEGQMKGIPTAADVLGAGRNAAYPSVARSISPGLFGPQVNPGALQNLGEIEKNAGALARVSRVVGDPTPAEGLGVLNPPPPTVSQPGEAVPATNPGTIPQPGVDGAPAGTPTGTVPPAAAGAGPVNTTGASLEVGPGGIKVLETPTTEGGKKTAGDFRETLKAGKENSLEFLQTAPKLLKALELLPNADMKKGGNLITDARKWAQTMGMSTDNANKIGDTETFLKTMMSPATGAARAFNSRATQLEFVQFLKAFAASQDTDPRAAANIITQMLLDGVNEHSQHLKNIEQAKNIPGMENAVGYNVPNFPSIENIAGAMDKTRLKTGLKQDPTTGLWSDTLAAQRGQSAYWPTPGPKAIEILKNGGSREKFDEYFGTGASDAILGPAKE